MTLASMDRHCDRQLDQSQKRLKEAASGYGSSGRTLAGRLENPCHDPSGGGRTRYVTEKGQELHKEQVRRVEHRFIKSYNKWKTIIKDAKGVLSGACSHSLLHEHITKNNLAKYETSRHGENEAGNGSTSCCSHEKAFTAMELALQETSACHNQQLETLSDQIQQHMQAKQTPAVSPPISPSVPTVLGPEPHLSALEQLHTATNLILLSLAVSDFLMGFLQMPVEILILRGCWLLGDFMCAVNYFMSALLASVSVGNILLISVDRYVAICDPMFYSTKVTMKRVQLCICLCWIFCAFYHTWFLRDFLKQPDMYNSCYGECVVVINYVDGVFDFILTFLSPIVVIIVLYMRVFVVAVSQARAMHSHNAAVTLQHSKTVAAKKSEIKAAMTLGVVVVVFLLCLCPFYIHSASLVAENVVLLEGTSVVAAADLHTKREVFEKVMAVRRLKEEEMILCREMQQHWTALKARSLELGTISSDFDGGGSGDGEEDAGGSGDREEDAGGSKDKEDDGGGSGDKEEDGGGSGGEEEGAGG
ncbi:Trace amine-associated receptor 1 [Nibea albiflora]|uniref:Trace amine-associated receptor 1 n=1 Tax=Nibea albiflora TaxID=240163 RepID=A0ACB7EH56_NIBAL|nr:Trace amine-associated receptor 1 [Nibea albiflora]